MSKIALVFLFTLSVCFAQAQDLPVNKEGKIEFTEVVTVSGFTSEQLSKNCKQWFNDTYKNLKNFKIGPEGKKFSDLHYVKSEVYEGSVAYEITVWIKEGKFKYSISEFKHKNRADGKCSGGKLENEEADCRGAGKMSPKKWATIKSETLTNMNTLIDSLKAGMAKVEAVTPGDW